MKLIKDKKSILIDITNSCINKCANCMRFCQLNNNPYFMNLHDVKNAIDSLDNWNGQISIMGGEPLLHPFFKEIMKYLQTKYKKKYGFFRYPISDIYDYALNTMPDNNGKLRLFTSVPKQFYDYFEDIDDTFHSLRCNDHSNHTNHFTTMVYYKDLGISDEEFIKQSKNCWVNNDCGAVINNHGAFFCEMAGAMDMLYDGNTGFKVQKDWWKETSYQKQMYWCQFCGARLGLPMAMDNENITYMSKTVFNMLLKNDNIKLNNVKLITEEDYKKNNYKWNELKMEQLKKVNEVCISTNNKNINPKQFTIGTSIFDIKNAFDWLIVGEDSKIILNKIKDCVLNPGCLYVYKNSYAINKNANSIADKELVKNIWMYFPLDKIVNIENVKINIFRTDDTTWQNLSKISLIKKILDKGV